MTESTATIKNKPLVSVIINCYNGENYIQSAIDSILRQTYDRFEIIIWDNRSSDRSIELVLQYDDPRIISICGTSHHPLYEARNFAYQATNGELITFLDVDDFWLPEKLEIQVSSILSTGADFSYTNFYRLNQISRAYKAAYSLPLPRGSIFNELMRTYCVGILTLMARKQVMGNLVGPFNPSLEIIGDYDLTMRLAASYRADAIDIPLAVYREHQASTSNRKRNIYIYELLEWINRKHSATFSSNVNWKVLKSKIYLTAFIYDSFQGNWAKAFSHLRSIDLAVVGNILNRRLLGVIRSISASLCFERNRVTKPTVVLTNSTCIQDTIGGSSRAVHDIATELAKSYNVTVFCFKRRSAPVEGYATLDVLPYRLIRVPYFNGWGRPFNAFTACMYFLLLFRLKKIHIMWGNSPEPWAYLPRWNVTKLIYTVHGPWIRERMALGLSLKIPRLMFWLVLRGKVTVHYNSRYVKKVSEAEFRFSKSHPSHTIPILINEKLLSRGRYSIFHRLVSSRVKNRKYVLIPRRLTPRTGVVELLNAAFKSETKLSFIVTGGGELAPEVQWYAKHDDNILYLGERSEMEMQALYSYCDIVCIPSLSAEGFGVSILYALAYGKPVAYTSVGAMKSTLSRTPGCINITLSNPSALLQLLETSIPPNPEINLSTANIGYDFENNLNSLFMRI